MKTKKCPRCGKLYSGPGALSRADNTTEICPACGMTEALKAAAAVKAAEGDPEESYMQKMVDVYKTGNMADRKTKARILNLFAEAAKHYADRFQPMFSGLPYSDLIFVVAALKLLHDGTMAMLSDDDKNALASFQAMAKFKVATIAKEGGAVDREKADALLKAGRFRELEEDGAIVKFSESGGIAQHMAGRESDTDLPNRYGEDSPEPSESVNIGGKTYKKTFVDLSGGSKAEKIDKLCGLINMILKPADPVVKHGALIAVQTMLCEDDKTHFEPHLQELHDTMNQYFDKYRSYLTEEERQLILSAFE